MPYTLAKFFLWGLLMALGGGIIGWLLRSLKCRAELARARTSTVDMVELGRLRGRLANLEPVVAERDRLRMELADVRGSSAGALGFASIASTTAAVDGAVGADAGADGDTETDTDAGMPAAEIEPDETAGEAATSDAPPSDAAGAAVPASDTEAADDAAPPDPEGDADAGDVPEAEPADAPLDLAAAHEVLGKKIKLDDLTVVEGIGPKIAELCNGIGISTWAGLASTDVAELQSMLDAAGSRFQMHKPATWPQQAGLLSTGQWADFKALTDSLTGGT